jgi:hypothetical protein
MTSRFALFDVITLPEGISGSGVPPGARGTVLDVYEEPALAYEIEVTDEEGRTLFLGAVDAIYVEPDIPVDR